MSSDQSEAELTESEGQNESFVWPAPDRDSPKLGTFEGSFEPSEKFGIFLQMDGLPGRSEDAVKEKTGIELSRPRRWHKIFERMGLLYPGDGNTRLARMGRLLRDASAPNGLKRLVGREALETLKRYQFDNPVERAMPKGCDIHPYYAVLKSAAKLDWKLHWDELNRELMRLTRDDQIDPTIAKIAAARQQPGYEAFLGTASNASGHLSERTHQAEPAPENKTPEGQLRDQKMTPFLKRAGYAEMFLTSPGAGGGGYWTVPDDVRDLVEDMIATPPVPKHFESGKEWIEWFCEGTVSAAQTAPKPKPLEQQTSVKDLDLQKLKAAIAKYDSDLIYSDQLLASVVAALRSGDGRNFIILRGISGTGKTRIVSAIARAVFDVQDVGLPYLTITEVRPDWTDGSYLLGHYDPIEARYVRQRFLEALLAADHAAAIDAENPTPVFVCLDEMNLARVEYYLADCLSAMESKSSIPLDVRDDQLTPASLKWPQNLYLFGTVNVDETTLPISDKVLDRAQVIDTSDIDLIPQLSRWLEQSNSLDTTEKELVANVVGGTWEALRELGSHFGFRTALSIVRYIEEAKDSSNGALSVAQAIDMQLVQKILVKLRGEGERWDSTLADIDKLLADHLETGQAAQIVKRMQADLDRLGSFQFWH